MSRLCLCANVVILGFTERDDQMINSCYTKFGFVFFFFLENKYLERNVTNRGIDIICNQLGKRSYQLAIELGLTPEEIERIQMDFPMSIDRSRKYLNKWRQRAPTPTYKVLLQALATVEVDNYMDILKRIY